MSTICKGCRNEASGTVPLFNVHTCGRDDIHEEGWDEKPITDVEIAILNGVKVAPVDLKWGEIEIGSQSNLI